MNIYEKIQQVRLALASEKIQKSGKNTFAKYDYFELDDFIKPLNRLMADVKMTAYTSFTAETATLVAVNCEKPEEQVVITSPFGSADLKGCHEVQNIGAVETYQRRYLYQALFDIAESDALNATQGKPAQKPEKPPVEPQTDNKPINTPFPREMSLIEANSVKITKKTGEEVFVSDLSDYFLEQLLTTTDEKYEEQRQAAKVLLEARKQ